MEDGSTELLGSNNIRRKQLTAEAWTNAINRLYDINQQRVLSGSDPLRELEYRNHFKTVLEDELGFVMTSVWVSYSGCSSDVNEARLKATLLCVEKLC